MTTTTALPHWDMSVIFPNLESPEFKQSYQESIDGVTALADLFDQLDINQRPAAPIDAQTVAALETVFTRFNTLLDQILTLGAYIQAFVTTDSRDTTAQARMSEFQQQMV